jgi:hypothetical protein
MVAQHRFRREDVVRLLVDHDQNCKWTYYLCNECDQLLRGRRDC